MDSPTGQQIEIGSRGARAVLTEVGATLRAFEVRAVPYVETFDAADEPPMGAGQVLFPWPNRVAGGRWSLDGARQQLELTEPGRGNAIHGLLRNQRWEVADRGDAWVRLAAEVPAQPGWPRPLSTTVTYEVDNWGLRVTHQVRNHGERSVPFGLGVHPYPKPGETPLAECELTVSAGTVLPMDPTMVPAGDPKPVGRSALDLRRGKAIGELTLDHAFGGIKAGKDGIVRHSITAPGTANGVELWAERTFRWVQVFTAENFPSATGFAVAIEPMTCPPDALNSGVDLINLAPGSEWVGRWGIRPLLGGAR